MDEEKKKILIKNAKEYFDSGQDDFGKERYNSALVLFFKCLIALVDLYVLQKTGQTPSTHSSRFYITRNSFPEVYDLIDKDFPFYQNSYIQIMTKDLVEVVKEDAEIMARKTQVEL